MLLCEIMSSTSVVDWFVESMTPLFRQAYDRAESSFNTSEDSRVARMQSGMVLGKWYSANVINSSGYSIRDLLSLLKPHSIELPDIITNRRQKEEMQYSSSKNLLNIIERLTPVLIKKGYKNQAQILTSSVNMFHRKMGQLLTRTGEPEPTAHTISNLGAQRNQANRVVQDTIQRLPADIRHSVRTAVAQQGNTLAALTNELNRRGITM